jgi:RNA polymerase sigma-70 factor (ECF subfamily)
MSSEIKAEMVALVPRLRRFAYALSGDRSEGDDLVQTACLKALARLEQFEPGTRLDSWMFRIIQTTFLDERRSARHRTAAHDPDAIERRSDEGLAAGLPEQRLLLARVRREIAALPPEQRAVMALVAIEGCSYKEAAEVLGTPVGTVMSRLARARRRLLPLMAEVAE